MVDTYRVEGTMDRPDSGFAASYRTDYRYAAAPWHNGFESVHRPLIEVVLSGTRSGGGTPEPVVRCVLNDSDAGHDQCLA